MNLVYMGRYITHPKVALIVDLALVGSKQVEKVGVQTQSYLNYIGMSHDIGFTPLYHFTTVHNNKLADVYLTRSQVDTLTQVP